MRLPNVGQGFGLALVVVVTVAAMVACGDSAQKPIVGASPAVSADPGAGTRKWSAAPPFGTSGQELLAGGACNFDSVDGKDRDLPSFTLRKGQPLRVTGWAAIAVAEGVLPESAALALKDAAGIRKFVSTTREKRDDVAKFFGRASLVDAGFSTLADTAEVSAGKYVLEIVQHKDGKTYLCGIVKQIDVVAE